MTDGNMLKLCFVGLDNYAFLRPDLGIEHMGGEAVQQSLLARQFASLGYSVSTIVLDYGFSDDGEIDGITLIKTYKPNSGVKGVRFFYPRLVRTWKALKLANADVYYQSPAGVLTGITAAYCRHYNKKFIFRVASDANCVPGKQLIRYRKDRKIYEYGLRSAHVRAVQTEKQAKLLADHYGLDSVVTNMVTEPAVVNVAADKSIDVLWVNNLRQVKRPDRVLEVARRLPEYNFVMIGGACRGAEALYEHIKREAKGLTNLEFRGSESFSDVNGFLDRSKILLNTSTVEGFPNTYLQAWIRGVPVVATFDPDDIIATRNLGAATGRSESLPELLVGMLGDENRLADYSARVSAFARQEFLPEVVIPRYLELAS